MSKETIDKQNAVKASADVKKEKKNKDSFEILIRGTEIFRINTKTKEIVAVFQCIDQCLRGKKEDEVYVDSLIVMGHQFSVTVKQRNSRDYILNVFGDTKFELEVEKNNGNTNAPEAVCAEYEECLDEYTASCVIEEDHLKIKVWITMFS